MPLLTWLLLLSFILTIHANTEKVIFTAHRTPCTWPPSPAHDLPIDAQLAPPWTLIRTTWMPHQSPQWYALEQLEDGGSYEVRVSYPATTPTDFNLTVMDACQLAAFLGTGTGRPASKTDPIVYWLILDARPAGVSYVLDVDKEPVIFDLVLETLYFGFLFYDAYKLVLACLVVILAGVTMVIPFVKNMITNQNMQETKIE